LWQPIGSSAQNSNYFLYADSLFANQNYFEAGIEFQRCIFYANTINEKSLATISYAKCNMHLNQYDNANSILNSFLYANVPDSIIVEARILHATAAYLAKDFEQGLSQFIQLEFLKTDSQEVNENRFLKVLILNELKRYGEAEQEFKKWVSSIEINSSEKDSTLKWVKFTYDKNNLPHLKSIRKAILLASFLPGFGHFYCGAYKEGIVNMILMLSSVTFAGVAVYFTYYVAGVVVGYGLFNRFQKGAIHRMDFLVDKFNYEKIRPFNIQIKNKIIELQSTKKPM
jgi:tetratricopeptide (TPR) repeat protein